MKAQFVNEAFEEKSKDRAKKELLYPEINNIKDLRSLQNTIYHGVPKDAIPQEVIDNVKNNIKNLKELEELAESVPVSKEDFENYINNSSKKAWDVHLWTDEEISGIDPCTNMELDQHMTIKELEQNALETVRTLFKEWKIKTVPASLRDFDIVFTGYPIDEEGGIENTAREHIKLEFFLKRLYNTKDSYTAWNMFIQAYFNVREVRMYEIDWNPKIDKKAK